MHNPCKYQTKNYSFKVPISNIIDTEAEIKQSPRNTFL